jgi:integrase
MLEVQPTKTIPAWYATRAKTGPKAPMQPITSRADIAAIKLLLKDSARDLALFTVGINTAYRASDYLGWKVKDVRGLEPSDGVQFKEQKTKKYRGVFLNRTAIEAINELLASRPDAQDDDYLFVGTDGRTPITVHWYGQLVKRWCLAVGMKGHFGSHTLRKTWGYMQRTVNNMALEKIQKAYGHASSAVTLIYVCIPDEEMRDMYMSLEL